MEETHARPHPQFRIETCFVQMKRDKHKLRKCKNMNSGARQMHFNVKLWVVNISCKNWLQRLSPEQENTSSFCKIGGKMCEKDLVMHPFKGTSTSHGCVCSSYNTQSHGQIHRKCLAKQKIASCVREYRMSFSSDGHFLTSNDDQSKKVLVLMGHPRYKSTNCF